MSHASEIRIGTSGWQYPGFRGRFYPPSLPSAAQLGFYSQRMRAVEVNRTFYHFSRASTYCKWRDATEKGFEVAVKAHRSFTHEHPLQDREHRLSELLGNMSQLGDKMGPLLFQLPASLGVDVSGLGKFLKLLPSGRPWRFTFEFRNPAWHTASVYRALEKRGIAFCIFDLRQMPSPVELTADFAYVRLHGPCKSPYIGAYSQTARLAWAERLAAWSRSGISAYLFFDNTMAGDAIDDARKLQDELECSLRTPLKAG